VVIGAAAVLESCAYGALKATNGPVHKSIRWIRENTIAHIKTIQLFFLAINTSAVLFCSKELLRGLQEKFSLSRIDLQGSPRFFLQLTGTLLTAYAIGACTVGRLFPAFQPFQGTLGDGLFGEIRTHPLQDLSRVIHVTKLVLQLALCFFTNKPLAWGVALVSTFDSYLKNSKIRWLQFFSLFVYNPAKPAQMGAFGQERRRIVGGVRMVKMMYWMLLLRPEPTTAVERCPSCDMQVAPNEEAFAFCPRHIVHGRCVAADIGNCIEAVVRLCDYRKNLHARRTGFSTEYTWEYDVGADVSLAPLCLECETPPLQNGFVAQMYDINDRRWYGSSVSLLGQKEAQHVFEILSFIYSTFQAALTSLQKHPYLAASIFQLQKVMMISDIVFLGLTGYYCYRRAKEKYLPPEEEQNTRKAARFYTAAAITAAGSALASCLAAYWLKACLKPSIELSELVKEMGLATAFTGLKVDWGAPLVYTLMQALYVNRSLATLALSFFSEQKTVNYFSLEMQLLSLLGISQLRWMELSFFPTLYEQDTSDDFLAAMGLKNVQQRMHYIVHPTSDKAHLRSILTSIATHADGFWDNASWYSPYWIHGTGGRWDTLLYEIFAQPQPVAPCDCGLTPVLEHVSLRGETLEGYRLRFRIK